jgi:hypothetical protein
MWNHRQKKRTNSRELVDKLAVDNFTTQNRLDNHIR